MVARKLFFTGHAVAASLSVTVQIPRVNVAEHHRPYVAIWIEREDQSVAANLSHWYDVELRDNEGTKWLKDMRQWWRRNGRELTFPVDGISSATRPVGEHVMEFDSIKPPLASLAPGQYRVVVEAAREVGGRELVRLPFSWPPSAAEKHEVRGKTELGRVGIELAP